jgi:SAM-dependent methyltransferase
MPPSSRSRSIARLQHSVAASLDMPRALTPHIQELFADLTSLGCRPRQVTSWLRAAGINARSSVIDMGCGKGAAGILAARTLGCRVIGFDACRPFIEEAQEAARCAGVADLCTFRCADLHRAAPTVRPADAALMLNVLPIEEAAPIVVRLVRPSGVFILDDAIVLEGRKAACDRPTRREAREFLQSLGAVVEREHVMSPREYRRLERTLYAAFAPRARELARRRPSLAPVVRRFLKQQRQSGAHLWRGPMRGAMWMARVH